MALTEEYKIQIRQLPLDVRKGATGADSGKDVVSVDWRPILHPTDPNIQFLEKAVEELKAKK